ncbi:MAG: peptide chain release factor N(5)-glutamine methyltransferase [Clostridia bacterium]|nr:peptide chain release factor N(5)-glutamine methyltransferase [Clostridia bacterium]
MTPAEAIREAAAQFTAAGIADARYDASLLLSTLLRRDPLALRLDRDTLLSPDDLSAFEKLTARRLSREPLQYILGNVAFLGHTFHCDPRALIPRPETELLAESAIEAAREVPGTPQVLDLCTGTGCIGISIALATASHVTLADISSEALALARENAEALHANVDSILSDLFSSLPGRTFDIITANPPYIPRGDIPYLQKEVLREPSLALDGGEDGLDLYRRLAADLPAHVHAGSRIFLEVGDGEANSVAALLEQSGFVTDVMKDYQQIDRIVKGTWRTA